MTLRQDYIDQVTSALWPGETTEEAALALCEEAGEVARAVIKRNHAARGEGDREGDAALWAANLRRELAQVVIVAAKIANREGFNLDLAIEEEVFILDTRAKTAGVWP